jgi:hypothetical protein
MTWIQSSFLPLRFVHSLGSPSSNKLSYPPLKLKVWQRESYVDWIFQRPISIESNLTTHSQSITVHCQPECRNYLFCFFAFFRPCHQRVMQTNELRSLDGFLDGLRSLSFTSRLCMACFVANLLIMGYRRSAPRGDQRRALIYVLIVGSVVPKLEKLRTRASLVPRSLPDSIRFQHSGITPLRREFLKIRPRSSNFHDLLLILTARSKDDRPPFRHHGDIYNIFLLDLAALMTIMGSLHSRMSFCSLR